MAEVMECVCGASGTIRERESDEHYAVIVCGKCGWEMRVTGLSLIMWGYRATSDDPSGELWKSAARMS